MAPKQPDTPKAKLDKPIKSGISKRSPKKTSPNKPSPSKTSTIIDKDLLFLWKCIKISGGLKIDWAAVAKDAGKPAGTLQKQYSRLNLKCEKAAAIETNILDKDADEKVDQNYEADDSE